MCADYPNSEDRFALCAEKITLNGRPAKISGAGRPFARVTDSQTGLSAEWSWRAVARIVAKGGQFRS